jgi:hypothetical protein
VRAVADALLTLRGPPNALDGPVPGLRWDEAVAPPEVQLDAPGAEAPLAAFVTLPDSVSLVGLRLVLPDTTPPGSYRGTLRHGKREIPVQAEVAADAALALLPGAITVAGAAGATVEVALTAVNTGNLPVALPERQEVGLFTTQGLDRALGRTLTGKAERGLERFDSFGSALADEHGGTMTVSLPGGVTIEPGETRELAPSLALPGGLRGEATYFGFWMAGGSRVQIEVEVKQARRRARR